MEHPEIYGAPAFYEIAFSYRDVPGQCDFLAALYALATGRKPASVLELACGPAVHAREFARRGLGVLGLDLALEMVAYAAERLGEHGHVMLGDMADFTVNAPVDLAFTLLDSLPYLTTNEELTSHFRCVRHALRKGGVYVAELRHPSDAHLHPPDPTTLGTWTEERDGTRVTTEWALEVTYDPIAQTERARSRLTVEQTGTTHVIDSWGIQRPLLPQELRALVELAGGWRFLGWWGDFDLDRPLGGSDEDWRMIVAWQRA